jgi:hypothetical protein
MTDKASKNWFQTLPGVLTAVAALLTALTGLVGALSGWFTPKDVPHPRANSEKCIPGYVWREATPEDHVCVTVQTHQQTLQDNMLAGSRRDPKGGPYGPDTCLQGFVWRDVFDGDHVCVTVETRAKVLEDDREGPNRVAR